ncbi:MAG TPA: FAD-dependent oxidoreductase, partial [Roseiflexaceae bacterium]|nr:FAD-dependent oxidoreductase [Roseiflexaceae bacterium]
PGAHMLAGIRATYEALGVPFETLDRDEIVRRFPQFRLPEGTIGYFQADYSLLAADTCVATLAGQARQHGAQLHEGETVLRIAAEGAGVVVETSAATYRAERAILCAGSWMPDLLRQLGLELPLTVTKELLAFYAAPNPADYRPGRFPLFIHRFSDTTSLGSGFPIFGHPGVKLMLDRTGPLVDPADPERSAGESQLTLVRDYVAQILPDLGDNIIDTVTCRYTMTPDEDFVIDRHPAHPQITLASPCSGHGFKFGVVIGRILADLATHGATEYPIGLFRLDRPALR